MLSVYNDHLKNNLARYLARIKAKVRAYILTYQNQNIFFIEPSGKGLLQFDSLLCLPFRYRVYFETAHIQTGKISFFIILIYLQSLQINYSTWTSLISTHQTYESFIQQFKKDVLKRPYQATRPHISFNFNTLLGLIK